MKRRISNVQQRGKKEKERKEKAGTQIGSNKGGTANLGTGVIIATRNETTPIKVLSLICQGAKARREEG